jgi:large subunit ribosomal protein L10
MRGMDWKSIEIQTLAELAKDNPVIGVASIHEIPARQFQSIRRELRGQVTIRVSKKTLIRQALDKTPREGLVEIGSRMDGEVALLFTDMNPFKLFRKIEDGKVSSPAKPGHRPPEDVWIPAGPTPFAPGPIVSQLQKVGIPARIERGKVIILQDTLFVKAGEEIDRERAGILSQLGIEPMRIGLDVSLVYEDGALFDRSVLDVDANEMLDQVSLAAQRAFNLAFNSAYVTNATVRALLHEAWRKARNLAVGAEIVTSETVSDLLSVAYNRMISLAAAIARGNPDVLGEDLRSRLSQATVAAPTEEKADEKKPEARDEAQEEEEKEEESVGLGALFG